MQSSMERFATRFFAMLDRRDGRLVCCNTGHPAPAILRGAHDVAELPPNSPMNGAFLDVPFANSETHLDTEDVMLLYTDGLIEARQGEALFGESRLFDLLGRCHGLDPEGLLERVVEAVDSFAGGRLADDLALLAVQRLDLPWSHAAEAPQRLRRRRRPRRQVAKAAAAASAWGIGAEQRVGSR